ncbi:thioredoxin family protein [archaeon 13_1_20CM_2_54_9]|nr:MAG: thioredoxin family protein [Crenarchaeota archaeon 13_1_40CM_3_53_5]OLE74283.1 MAG: thioredoxin family protein [archaeon 13_1_20CM_2_54_9]
MTSLEVGTVGLPLGSQAIDFKLMGIDGKNYSLSSFNDKKALVVVFSCNHCPYVRDYEDRMVLLQHDYAPKGATLIAINSNDETNYPEDNFPNMVQRAKDKGFNFPYLRDETQDTAKKYGGICTPHVFAFDHKRVLQYKGRIDDNRNAAAVKTTDLKNALDSMLVGKTPPVQETRPFGCSIKWKQ